MSKNVSFIHFFTIFGEIDTFKVIATKKNLFVQCEVSVEYVISGMKDSEEWDGDVYDQKSESDDERVFGRDDRPIIDPDPYGLDKDEDKRTLPLLRWRLGGNFGKSNPIGNNDKPITGGDRRKPPVENPKRNDDLTKPTNDPMTTRKPSGNRRKTPVDNPKRIGGLTESTDAPLTTEEPSGNRRKSPVDNLKRIGGLMEPTDALLTETTDDPTGTTIQTGDRRRQPVENPKQMM